MYSKEEVKKLKKEFWSSFGHFSQLKRTRLGKSKKWVLYKTGIKGLELKFNLSSDKYFVGIEINSKNSKYDDYINKINLLKDEITPLSELVLYSEKILLEESYRDTFWFFYEKSSLNYKNQKHWPEIFEFFFDHMIILENFIIENKEILNQ